MATVTPRPLTDEQIITSFACYDGPPVPGFIVDFLGTKTRTSYLAILPPEGGLVEGYPLPVNFHATALEWAGALRAVLAATTELVVVELGAGWGPWLISLTCAARQRGIHKVRLVGVEGSKDHCDYLTTHFSDNGLDPEQHTLLHGVVGTADGVAEFPVLDDPTALWGAAAVDPGGAGSPLWRFGRRGYRALRSAVRTLVKGQAARPVRTERVPCYSLRTLLRPLPPVDLIHVDIQGDEHKVLASARSLLKSKVKRLVVGTHGRAIEQQLLEELAAQGWILEAEEGCKYRQDGARMMLDVDGCQVWRNAALTAA